MVGSQAFQSASVFNANIGAWNTEAITTLTQVSAFSAVARNAARSCARSGYNCIYIHTSRLEM